MAVSKRETQQVRETEGRNARSAHDLQWMQEDGKVQRFDPGKNRFKERIIEIALVDVGAHVDAL